MTSARRGLVAILAAVAATLIFAGCSAPSTPSTTASSGNYVIPSSGKPPEYVPDGTPEYNAVYLAYIVAQAQAKNPDPPAKDVAQAVAASELARAGIQYTSSSTAVGLNADSVYIAVPWGDKCMIAQYGPVMTGVHTAVLPVLKQGGCLIGPTVQTLR